MSFVTKDGAVQGTTGAQGPAGAAGAAGAAGEVSTAAMNAAVAAAVSAGVVAGRTHVSKGANVAIPVNGQLTLGTDGNMFVLTGNNDLKLIDSTGWQAGDEITLIFNATMNIKNAQVASGNFKPIQVYSNSDMAINAITPVIFGYDGTKWRHLAFNNGAQG